MPDILTFPGQLNVPDMFNSTPAGFVRTADGRLVPAQAAASVMNGPSIRKKNLLCLLYWRGDIERVDRLGQLIADLERVHNPDWDVLLFGRKDCRPVGLQYGTIEALRRKFATVHILDDAGNFAQGFPWAANDMWQDLVGRLSAPVWTDRYKCFINLEWDCCPTRPGWLNELAAEFEHASRQNLVAVGAMQSDPMPHLNGVALYAIDLTKRVQGLDGGCPPDAAYDIAYAGKILPLAMGTPKIALDYRRATITPDELFASPACLYHGVRDESANAAVRAEHIDHVPRAQQTFAASTVFTYRRRIVGADDREIGDRLALWAQGFRTAGWNPVILGRDLANRHPKHAEYMATVAQFPTAPDTNIEVANARWESFLALAVQGGGLLAEFDTLPNASFQPASLPAKAGIASLGGDDRSCLVLASQEGANAFVDAVLAYQPTKDETQTTPANVLKAMRGDKPATVSFVADCDDPNYRAAKVVHFGTRGLKAAHGALPKSRAMMSCLRGL